MARPQGAPRGLLLYYILHRISLKPAHGYEILQDIESKTEGAWRPGPGSIYPMLKKLVSQGYIKAESDSVRETAHHVYQITPEGLKHLHQAKEMFANAGQRWTALRRIFIDMLDPKDLGRFFMDGSKLQLQLAKEMLESKMSGIEPSELEFMLKEYALNLERQLDWTKGILNKMQENRVVRPRLVKQR